MLKRFLQLRSLAEVVRDTGWVGVAEFVTLVSGLAVLNVLIVGLGPAGYGRYAAVQALAATFTTLACSWVVMLLFQHAMQQQRVLRDAFGSAFSIVLCTASLAWIVGTGVATLLLPALPIEVIAAFMAAELVAGALVGVGSAAVQLELGMPTATKLRLLPTVGRFLVVVGLGVTGNARLEVLGPALLIAQSLAGVFVLLWAARRLRLPLRPGRPSLRDARDGFPHAGVLAALAVQEDSDKVLMIRLADPVDAGLYAAAYRLVQLGLIPMRALVGATHPRFLVETPGRTNEHLRRALHFTAPCAAYGVLATVVVLVGAPLVPELLGAEYEGTAPILLMLAPYVLLRGLTLFPMNALLGLTRYRLRFWTILLCSLLNVSLNLALIPLLGVEGAVISTIVTEVVFIVGSWWALVRAQARHDREKRPDEREQALADA